MNENPTISSESRISSRQQIVLDATAIELAKKDLKTSFEGAVELESLVDFRVHVSKGLTRVEVKPKGHLPEHLAELISRYEAHFNLAFTRYKTQPLLYRS